MAALLTPHYRDIAQFSPVHVELVISLILRRHRHHHHTLLRIIILRILLQRLAAARCISSRIVGPLFLPLGAPTGSSRIPSASAPWRGYMEPQLYDLAAWRQCDR